MKTETLAQSTDDAFRHWKTGTRECIVFECPGCGYPHLFDIKTTGGGAVWRWDGDIENPTLSPSLVALAGKHRCHLFLKGGVVKFLGDCTHKLANTSQRPEKA